MYVSTFPCKECAIRIKEVGIKEVYFLDVQNYKLSKEEMKKKQKEAGGTEEEKMKLIKDDEKTALNAKAANNILKGVKYVFEIDGIMLK